MTILALNVFQGISSADSLVHLTRFVASGVLDAHYHIDWILNKQDMPGTEKIIHMSIAD